MEPNSSRSNLKRLFFEDDTSDKPPPRKRVRFPKGKKPRSGDEAVTRARTTDDPVGVGIGPAALPDPRSAAKERAKRRAQITTELFTEETAGILPNISAAEVTYKDYEDFVEDGIQIEPFNLDKEREEGYFDADGNFVEYANENQIKDAWLDSVEAVTKYTGKAFATKGDDDVQDLSSDDIGKIKRCIADVLEPEETVLQGLRRLKGTSNNKKKMSAETQRVFDQLTEDAMNLMDNGESNVYHEKKEIFLREAEGYESLARARREGTSNIANQGKSVQSMEWSPSSDASGSGVHSSVLPEIAVGTSNFNASTAEISINGADEFDIFGEEDEPAVAKPSSEGSNVISDPNSDGVKSTYPENGVLQNDYVFDDSSGYYYSSSLGYYYDSSTGLYCSAASGLWYSFNEETGAYDEIQEAATNVN